MTLDKSKFNIEPYYDDYDENKKFLQILFKPGYSVQARELTQLQTILSNQTGRFADHMFENGTVIKGGGITEQTLKFVRLKTTGDSSTVDIDDLIGYNLEYTHTIQDTEDVGTTDELLGTETTVIGKVIHAIDSTTDDPHKILFIDVMQDTQDTTEAFVEGTINIVTTNPNIAPSLGILTSSTFTPTGNAILISIEKGLFYVEGYFVINDAQTIPAFELESNIRKFNPADRTLSVGFDIVRTITTSSSDITLQDPSQGSYNYNAPGADRFNIKLEIKQIPYVFDENGYRSDKDTENYFEWARIIKGETFKNLKYPDYAELEETFARRTYDESGHYTVRPFGIETVEYADIFDPTLPANKSDHYNYLAIGLQTGKAYVRGYEFELQNTEHIVGKRARSTEKQNDRTLDIDIGNYVLVEHNMDGITPLYQKLGAMDTSVNPNAPFNIIGGSPLPEWKKVNLSTIDAEGTMVPVGCARVFQISPHAHDQGALGVGTTYRVYLNSIIFGSAAGFGTEYDSYTMKDVTFIADPTSGKKIFKTYIPPGQTQNEGLHDKGQTSLIFKVPVGESVKQVTGLDYYMQRDFTFSLTKTGGIWSGTVTRPNGTVWQGENEGGGIIGDITNTDEYLVTVDGYLFDMNPASTGDYGGNTLGVDSNVLTINLSSTATNSWSGTKKGQFTSQLRINADDEIVSNPQHHIRKKILKEHTVTIDNLHNADTSTSMWNSRIGGGWGLNLGYPDIFKLVSVKERTSGIDYTDKFTLDNGQKLHLYDHGSVILDRGQVGGTGGPGANPFEGFDITFLYFDHQTWDASDDSTDFTTLKYPCVVNSYIHSDHEVTGFDNGGVTAEFGLAVGNTLPAELSTYNFVPTFSDPKTGQSLELTDAIDFRPIKVGYWDGGPAPGNTTLSDQFGKIRGTWTPQDGKLFFADYEHYLPRVDKVVLTKDREFKVLEGVPSVNAIAPEHNPQDMMPLYKLHWNPYTFNAEDVGQEYINNQRYTMEMIGEIDGRLTRLEKTTKLSLSELEGKIESHSHGDKFTNAMAVEDFSTLVSAEIESSDYNVSFDATKGQMQPASSVTNINLFAHTIKTLDSGITSSDDNIYTLTPTTDGMTGTIHHATVNNLMGNVQINPNPFSKTNWLGNLKLSPSSDDWFNITKAPKVKINDDSTNDPYVTSVLRKHQGIRHGFGAWHHWWLHHWAGYHHGHHPHHHHQWSRRGHRHRTSHRFHGHRHHWGHRHAYHRQWNPVRRSAHLHGHGHHHGWAHHHHHHPHHHAHIVRHRDKIIDKSIVPRVREREITLTASNMKPNTRYWAFINKNLLGYAINKNGYVTASDNAMRTDAYGNASCIIKIPNNNPYISSKILIRLSDSKTNTASLSTTAAEAFYVVGNVKSQDGLMSGTREISAKRDSVNSERITQDASTQSQVLSGVASYFDPLAQVFEIDSSKYPKGIFASSVDLFFREYDTGNLPFSVEIRPIQNGAPHPTTAIPLSEVTKTSDFTQSKNGPDTTQLTRFEFSTPVFLDSGKYALVLKTNSTKYNLWGTEFGKKGMTFDGSSIISDVEKQPYVGNLWLPQNNGKRFEDKNNNVMFRLNRAKYSTSGPVRIDLQGATSDTINADATIVTSPDFHEVTLLTEYNTDPGTSINHYMHDSGLSKDIELVVNGVTKLSKRKTYDLVLDQDHESDESLVYTMMETKDANLTPVLDMDRLSVVLSKFELSNDVSQELLPEAPSSDTTPVARYLGKVVNTGNEANSVNVTFDASMKYGTNVKVYAKTTNSIDENIHEKNFEELTANSSNNGNPSSVDESEFYQYKYSLNKTDGFTNFVVKIVLIGDSTKSDVPIVKNLKSYALYDPTIDTSL